MEGITWHIQCSELLTVLDAAEKAERYEYYLRRICNRKRITGTKVKDLLAIADQAIAPEPEKEI